MATMARYDGLADWYEGVAAPSVELSRDAIAGLLGRRSGLCFELGCGTGLYGPMLGDAGRDVIGIDVSVDQLRYARSRETVASADAAMLPFRDACFDDVACIWAHGDLDDVPPFSSPSSSTTCSRARFACSSSRSHGTIRCPPCWRWSPSGRRREGRSSSR
jgi:SAM-dependent methyltransferase